MNYLYILVFASIIYTFEYRRNTLQDVSDVIYVNILGLSQAECQGENFN